MVKLSEWMALVVVVLGWILVVKMGVMLVMISCDAEEGAVMVERMRLAVVVLTLIVMVRMELMVDCDGYRRQAERYIRRFGSSLQLHVSLLQSRS